MIRNVFNVICLVAVCVVVQSCGGHSAPTDFAVASESLSIYPDYCNVDIPYNIAPLNFVVRNSGRQACLTIEKGGKNVLVVSSDDDMKIIIPKGKWHDLLFASKGETLNFTVFVKKEDGKWVKYNTFTNKVSAEAVDKYLTYRLIEPSYVGTGNIGIYQYDVEEAEQTAIITNHCKKKLSSNREQCCMNCHYSQRGNPQNTMFYYRGPTGGLILSHEGKIRKINTRAGDMFSGTVYGSWHPTLPFIAFSSNVIRQSFPNIGKEKVYVYDFVSDLVLYSIEKNEITAIFKTRDVQETFPNWNSDGTVLYYCSSDSTMHNPMELKKMKYDLKCVRFNIADTSWNEPEMIYNASKEGKSAIHPRSSFDDKYLLFTKADFGPNAYTQKCADLYLMDLETKAVRGLDEVNTPESECYHSWSSFSNWFLYVGRVDDGNYGRVYLAHVDSFGHVSKPVMLPHENPTHDLELLKSYNAPEFATAPVQFSQKEYEDVIFNGETLNAGYGSPIIDTVDSYTGASQIYKR